MKKYLIIPDVHGRSFWKKSVYDYLENHPEVKIIFLGDYLDPYQYEGIYPDDAIPVFEEIISLKKQYPDRIILLIGNHDLHYVQNHRRGCRMDYMNKDKIVGLFDDNKKSPPLWRWAVRLLTGCPDYWFRSDSKRWWAAFDSS